MGNWMNCWNAWMVHCFITGEKPSINRKVIELILIIRKTVRITSNGLWFFGG